MSVDGAGDGAGNGAAHGGGDAPTVRADRS